MSRIDDLINQALSAEDEALLERYGREPSYFRQAFSLFRGRLGWVMWLVYFAQLLLFVGAIYAFWQMFRVEDLLVALRWGVATVALVQMSTFLRGFMGMHFEANRVLREVQRLELRLIRLERGEGTL